MQRERGGGDRERSIHKRMSPLLLLALTLKCRHNLLNWTSGERRSACALDRSGSEMQEDQKHEGVRHVRLS